MYTDTGELAAAAYTWGVAHPSGYPLFTLLAHVWCMIPWSSVIGGLNVLAAVYVATGVAIFSGMLQRMHHGTSAYVPASIGAAVGLSPLVWSQSTAFEVYSLHFLLLVAALYYALRYRQESLIRFLHSSALFLGLGVANHLSTVFLVPGFIVLWWNGGWSKQKLSTVTLISVLPLLLYVLLPLRSSTLPPINWGWVHRSWDAFVYHVRGKQFGVWLFSDNKAVETNASILLASLSEIVLWIGWIPVLIGLWVLYQRSKSIAVGLLVLAAGNLIISLGYAIPDIESYFLPTAVVVGILFYAGVNRLVQHRTSNIAALLLLIPVTAFTINLSSINHRSHTAVEEYAQFCWDHLEPNAILITRQWDYLCSAMWYHQVVNKQRPDVVVIDKELFRRTWYIPHLQHWHPDVMERALPFVNDYMIWLNEFEADSDSFNKDRNKPNQIQQRFIALLNAILDSNQHRPLYVTPEVVAEEKGFAPGYRALPVANMYRLTKDTSLVVRTKPDRLSRLALALDGKNSRLDKGLRETIMGMTAADAIYHVQFLNDSATGYRLRDLTIAFDPKHRISRTLLSRIP